MSPIFTALLPTILGGIGLIIQFYFNIEQNKLWAHGSKFLIFMQLFSLFQYIFMVLLVWNNNFYLYTLRVIRYIVSLEALAFLFLYIITLGVFLDLLFLKK